MIFTEDIRLGCENAIIHNLDENNLSDTISISYVGINELINFLKSDFGKKIIELTNLNKIKLIIYPTDSLCLTNYDYDNLIEYVPFLRNENIIFYHSWYNQFINFNLYCGSHIHNALNEFILYFENKNKNLLKANKHFLTLNNNWNIAREELFDFYDNLNFIDKEKINASFNFKNIFLNNIREQKDLFYSENIFDYYEKSLIEIITESHFDSITEKSYKPIIAGIPFIYWGTDSQYKVEDCYKNQIDYFKEINIDVNYFEINYKDVNNTKEKIKELLELPINEIIEKYKNAFEKAKENQIKILNHLSQINEKIRWKK